MHRLQPAQAALEHFLELREGGDAVVRRGVGVGDGYVGGEYLGERGVGFGVDGLGVEGEEAGDFEGGGDGGGMRVSEGGKEEEEERREETGEVHCERWGWTVLVGKGCGDG